MAYHMSRFGSKLLLVLLILSALLFDKAIIGAQPQSAFAWDYRTFDVTAATLSGNVGALTARLNGEGAQGWEGAAALGSQVLLRRPPGGGLGWEYQPLDVSTTLFARDMGALSKQLDGPEAEGWEASFLLGPYLLLKRPLLGGGPWEHVAIDATSILFKSDQRTAAARLNALGAQGWELTLVYGSYLVFKRPTGSRLSFEYLRDDSAGDLQGEGAGASSARLVALGAQGWELMGASGTALLLRRAKGDAVAWDYQGVSLATVLGGRAGSGILQLTDLGNQGYEPALVRENLLVLKRPGAPIATGGLQPSATALPSVTPSVRPSATPGQALTSQPTRAPTSQPTRTATRAPTRTPVVSPTVSPSATIMPTTAVETAPGASDPALNRPIVFIPGYSSCSESILGVRPRWEVAEPLAEANVARTALLPVVAEYFGYGPLLRAFLAADFQLSRDLFVFCPDWAESMAMAADRLAATVQRAADVRKDDPPVTLLTHSDGGLVARYYLQQHTAESRKLVADLVMIAPPNHGIATSYYPWEGGDLSHDRAEMRWLMRLALSARCLRPVDGLSDDILSAELALRCIRTGSLDAALAETGAIAAEGPLFYAWLLADNDFLDDGTRKRSYPNAPIRQLNEPAQIEALFAGLQGSVVVLAGAIEGSTRATVPVQPRLINDPPLWSYGRPDPSREAELADGDGVVLLESTRLPIGESSRYRHLMFRGSDHYGLLTSPEVYAQLGMLLNVLLQPVAQPAPEVAVREQLNLLLAVVWSPVELSVHDPEGRAVGIDEQGALQQEIPAAYYGVDSDLDGAKFIILPEAIDGVYRFELRGTGNGSFLLQVETGLSERPLLLARGTSEAGQARTYIADYQSGTTGSPPWQRYVLHTGLIVALLLVIILLFFLRRRPANQA